MWFNKTETNLRINLSKYQTATNQLDSAKNITINREKTYQREIQGDGPSNHNDTDPCFGSEQVDTRRSH